MHSLQEQLDNIKNEKKLHEQAFQKLSKFHSIVLSTQSFVYLILLIVAVLISVRIWQNDESNHSTGELIWYILGTIYFGVFVTGILMLILTEAITPILQYLYQVPAHSYQQYLSEIENFDKKEKFLIDKIRKGKQTDKLAKISPVNDLEIAFENQTQKKDGIILKPSYAAQSKSTSEINSTNVPQSLKPKPYTSFDNQEGESNIAKISKPTGEKQIPIQENEQASEKDIVPIASVNKIGKGKPTAYEEEKLLFELFSISNSEESDQQGAKIFPSKTPLKIDFIKLNEHRANIGFLGELYILEKEQIQFASQSKIFNGEAIVHISVENDSEGYDIISFTDTGERKYIEVKTTTGNEFEPFYLSNCEMEAMNRLNNYWIYRVYNFDIDLRKGDLFKIDCKKDFGSYFTIQSSSFKVTPKGN
jgi:hypothetical protein